MYNQQTTRFENTKSDEYFLLRKVWPHFIELQRYIGQLCAKENGAQGNKGIKILDIGCGDGVTSQSILNADPSLMVISIDPEAKMIAKANESLKRYVDEGRCKIIQVDALGYLEQVEDGSLAIVASAMVLHNLNSDYRRAVHERILASLRPGGLFLNADKYSPQDDQERFEALRKAVSRFFDVLMPLEKYKTLEDWTLHYIDDQAPCRVMKMDDARDELSRIGFEEITIHYQENIEAVLAARKRR